MFRRLFIVNVFNLFTRTICNKNCIKKLRILKKIKAINPLLKILSLQTVVATVLLMFYRF